MSAEAPQKIDLSQDIETQNQQLHLSDTQRASYQEYLNTLEEAERNRIIYLTTQELEEFKTALDIETSIGQNPRGATDSAFSRSESISTFMGEQITEGLSLSDIMGEDFEHAEELDMLDGYTKDILFGSEGVLSSLDISDTAQDHFSLALSLSLIEKLASGEIDLATLVETGASLNPEDQEGALRTLFGDMLTSLEGLQTLAGEEENIGVGSIRGSRLHISDNGETNSIFMNPEEGKAFFDRLLSGEMSVEEIETTLESKNDAENIGNIDLSSIRVETAQDIQSLETQLENLSLQGRLSTAEAARRAAEALLHTNSNPNDTTETPVKKGLLAKLIEAIMGFLSGLTDGLDEVLGVSPVNPARTPAEGPAATEVAPQKVQEVRNFFRNHPNEGVFVGMNRESITALFPESGTLPEGAQNIIRRLDAIPGEETLTQKMQHLFIDQVPKVDGDTSQGNVPRIERFLSDMHDIAERTTTLRNADGTINAGGMVDALTAYNAYRVANETWKAVPANAALNRNMTFGEYFRNNVSAGQE